MRDAWTEAFAIAKDVGVGYVVTDMLLMGLTRTEAADVLAAAGATEAAVTAIVTQTNVPERWRQTQRQIRRIRA